ncbi:hypothetical protein Aperf_G00000037051 [Anoplocephala perfoliata]
MPEKGVFGVQERFLSYSKPELLQIASYLAQHDVAFNNIPEYYTENSADQSVRDHKSESIIQKEKPKDPPPAKFPPKSYSPPVRDTGVEIPSRKPLHAPTERQLIATQASHLRQLINKSRAALLKLDNEILAERSDLSLRRPDLSDVRLPMPRFLPRQPAASSGVLKPSVRILGDKRIRKPKRPLATAHTPLDKVPRVTPKPQASRDMKILSSYLKKLALEADAREQPDNLQKTEIHQPKNIDKGSADYQRGSCSPSRQQYPPGLATFLEKWGSKLSLSDVKETRGVYISSTHRRSPENSPDLSSTSTDSIGEFIRRHTKCRKPYRNSSGKNKKTKQVRLKSPPETINELKEDEAPYRTLRLPVEQHQKFLTRRRTAEVAQANRWSQSDLLSSCNSGENIDLIQLCDWLAEEIVDTCIEANANLIDSLSNGVIDELLHNELAISASSSWSSFSGLARSPQPREPSSVNQPLPSNSKTHHSIESKTMKTATKLKDDPVHKSELQQPSQTTPKMISPIAELIAPANVLTPQKKDRQIASDSDSTEQAPEIKLTNANSSVHEPMIAGDGSLVEESVAECSKGKSNQQSVERFSTPEEMRLKNSESDTMPHKLTGRQQSIKSASEDSDTSIPSRVSSRKGSELSEEKSSLQDDSISFRNKAPMATNRSQSPDSKKSTLPSIPNDSPLITSDGLSTPKPVTLHNRVFSLDLITSLTSSSIPDIDTPDVSISSSNGTIQEDNASPSSAGAPSCHVYEDDFESTEGTEPN